MRDSSKLPEWMTALQGWQVLRVWRGAVYVRIPDDYARVIEGGCSCQACKNLAAARPGYVPRWDTLGIPLLGLTKRPADQVKTWTVHAPEWQPTDRISAAEREITL